MNRERDGLITSDNIFLSPTNLASCETDLTRCVGQPVQSIAPLDRSVNVASYVAAAASSNTRRAYRHDLADFHRFGGSIPCSAELLAEYLAFRAADCSTATIARRLVGIGRAHTSLGFSDPGKTDLVRTVLKGIRRTHGSAQRRAKPLTRDQLLVSLPVPRSTRDIRDRALLLLGFASALRRSELISLDVGDVRYSDEGITIHLASSKTDAGGFGRQIAVPHGRSTTACPVLAVQAWVALLNATSGPLFRPVNKAGAVGTSRLSASTVNVVIKRAVSAAGIESAHYSGHSLRAGLITSAAQAGVSLHKIMEQSGHRSVQTVTRYIRDACLFEGNAAGAVL